MAVVTLVSGGLDSAVLAAEMRKQHASQTALTVNYGQVARTEIMAAKEMAALYADRHVVFDCNLAQLSHSAITGKGPMPEGVADGITRVYLPGRNTVLLSLAVTLAESIAADYVAIGSNADDAAGFPDCRPEFFQWFDALGATLGQRVRVVAPFVEMTKAQIVELGRELNVPMDRTVSCYRGTDCGRCESCLRRKAALETD
jgi:7-cyano-7-deazaguanine synthase